MIQKKATKTDTAGRREKQGDDLLRFRGKIMQLRLGLIHAILKNILPPPAVLVNNLYIYNHTYSYEILLMILNPLCPV